MAKLLLFTCRLHADEANGSIQRKLTHLPRLCVKTADNCYNSYFILNSSVH